MSRTEHRINSPALFYSYSFSPNYEWTSLFPPGEEIQQYLEGVCGKKKSNILDNIQLNTEVSEARWVEQDSEWEVRVTKLVPFTGDLSEFDRQSMIQKHGRSSVYLDTELIRSKILVTCAGELVEPNSWPRDVPGIESFQGDVFHSARWKSDVTLTDKNVVVVGTGCTSAQLVPSLTKAPFAAKSVTQLMRAPPWVMPRPQTPPAWVKHSSIVLKTVPGLGLFLRYFLFLYAESTWLNVGMGWFGQKRRQWFQGRLLSHLKKTVPEKYHEILTPQFGVGCRRIIIDGGWLEFLNLSNVELTTRPLVSVGAQSIVLGPQGPSDGDTETVTKPADVIILANGFETSTYLHRIKVQGTNGVFLHDVWNGNGGPGAYLSTAVHGFPNFFMVLGPNSVSGHSSAILASENIAGYALNFIKIVLSEEARTVEVRRDAEQEYTAEVQKRSLDKVWQACRNGYIQEGGWNSSICP